jgi:hypothetical protein
MIRPMAKHDDRILDELGGIVRRLARLTGGPDDVLLLTGTQRLALFELGSGGPLRLVERQQDPADRRAQRIALTADGRSRFDERNGRVAAAFGPAARSLSREERAQLAALLARLRAALD